MSVRLGLAWLLLLAVWLYAPDLAVMLGHHPGPATYRANGAYGAALAAALADAYLRPRSRPAVLPGVVCALASLLWAAQYACDWWYDSGASSSAICDDITGRPITVVVGCAIIAIAAAADVLMTRRRHVDSC